MKKPGEMALTFVFVPTVVLCAVGASPTGAAYMRTAVVATAQAVGIAAGTAPQIGPAIKAGQDAAAPASAAKG